MTKTQTEKVGRVHVVPTRKRALARKQFHFFPDGTVCLSRYGYPTFEYAKAHLDKFDGDEERALFHAMEKANFAEFDAFVQELYRKDPESFIAKAPVIVGPYKDKTKVYDPEQRNHFKLQFKSPNYDAELDPSLDAWLDSVVMFKADRLEVAVAIWEHSTNTNFDDSSNCYHLDRVTEFDKDMKELNVWKARSPQTMDYELVLIDSTTTE